MPHPGALVKLQLRFFRVAVEFQEKLIIVGVNSLALPSVRSHIQGIAVPHEPMIVLIAVSFCRMFSVASIDFAGSGNCLISHMKRITVFAPSQIVLVAHAPADRQVIAFWD